MLPVEIVGIGPEIVFLDLRMVVGDQTGVT
jgi:hypothetical protein